MCLHKTRLPCIMEAQKGAAFMNTLLHICCAPCANQCIDVLRTDGCAVTGY